MAEGTVKTLDEMIAETVAANMSREREQMKAELRASFDGIFSAMLRMHKYSPQDLLDEQEVSEYTGLSVSALQSWRKEKKNIPYVKLSSKSVRYKFKDVLDFVEKGRVLVAQDGRVI